MILCSIFYNRLCIWHILKKPLKSLRVFCKQTREIINRNIQYTTIFMLIK